MYLVVGIDMETNSPCCRGMYQSLEVAKKRLINLMSHDDGIDNYVIQQLEAGNDYIQPRTFILEEEKQDKISLPMEDKFRSDLQEPLYSFGDEVHIQNRIKEMEKLGSTIEQFEGELDKLKQNWLQKQVEIHEIKQMINGSS